MTLFAGKSGTEASKAARLARAKGDLPPLPRLRDYRAAIRSKCVECMGGADPLPIGDIRRCAAGPGSAAPCPLHGFRPFH